jgi:pyruvate dehydrogenase E1 component alpha subunit
MASVTAGGEIATRAASFGMESQVVDGKDLWAVREAALGAAGRARAGQGPTLLECQTYRHYGHSKSDPAKYRPPDEVERWLARDPLDLARARLLDMGLSDDELAAKDAEIDDQMERAVEGALAAAYPDPEQVSGTEFKE